MTTALAVDVEGATRSWLRDHPTVADAVTKTFVDGLPKDYKPGTDGACINVVRVGGRPDLYVPLDTADLQLDVWAGRKHEAADVLLLLLDALRALAPGTVTDRGELLAAEVLNVLYLPDPESDTPRYAVTAAVTARALQED